MYRRLRRPAVRKRNVYAVPDPDCLLEAEFQRLGEGLFLNKISGELPGDYSHPSLEQAFFGSTESVPLADTDQNGAANQLQIHLDRLSTNNYRKARLQGNTSSRTSATGELSNERPSSPPSTPGSPLTYSPSVAMEPIGKVQEDMVRAQATEFHGLAGWPAQPKLVPTVIVCEYAILTTGILKTNPCCRAMKQSSSSAS